MCSRACPRTLAQRDTFVIVPGSGAVEGAFVIAFQDEESWRSGREELLKMYVQGGMPSILLVSVLLRRLLIVVVAAAVVSSRPRVVVQLFDGVCCRAGTFTRVTSARCTLAS